MSEPSAPAKQPDINERISAAVNYAREQSGQAPPEQPAPEPEATVEVTEAPDGAEGVEDAAQDTAPEQQDAEAPDDSEAPAEISTLSELAEHLGVEVADLYNLSFPVTEGSTKREVTLGEYKDAIQSAGEIDKQRADIKKAREALEREQASAREQYERAVREAAALTAAAEKRLISDMESIDWAGLRESDPSEWAARKQEFAERQNEIEKTKAGVEAEFKRALEENQQQFRQQQEQVLEREREALLAAMPTWKDPEVAKSETAALRSYLANVGFSDTEIDQAYDHRMVVMAMKAKAYDETVKAAEVAKKRVVRIGRKTVTPGSPRGKAAAREDRETALAKRLQQSGRVEDAASLISARRNR